jgi:hypothetical protein
MGKYSPLFAGQNFPRETSPVIIIEPFQPYSNPDAPTILLIGPCHVPTKD